MQILQLTDKNQILNFLETDRLYAAYAIGDLEAALFAQSEWWGAELDGSLRAITLVFKGLEPPALFLMGEPAGLEAILRLPQRHPERVFVTCRQQHLETARAFYRGSGPPVPMWRMVLQQDDFMPAAPHPSPQVEALRPQAAGALEQLFAQDDGADAFSPAQLAAGVFYGIYDGGQLVAAAGTHLVSPTYRMGAVGNVYTHQAYRGQGYGASTTSAVVAELFQRGIHHVFLNVEQANAQAIQVYERLGFTRYCPFVEMIATRRL